MFLIKSSASYEPLFYFVITNPQLKNPLQDGLCRYCKNLEHQSSLTLVEKKNVTEFFDYFFLIKCVNFCSLHSQQYMVYR